MSLSQPMRHPTSAFLHIEARTGNADPEVESRGEDQHASETHKRGLNGIHHRLRLRQRPAALFLAWSGFLGAVNSPPPPMLLPPPRDPDVDPPELMLLSA